MSLRQGREGGREDVLENLHKEVLVEVGIKCALEHLGFESLLMRVWKLPLGQQSEHHIGVT